eukprot:CAMPEP_0114116218 /NCGR_PEP_ID=MMETSP0043_2-20121206/4382_1 /TAXON_ID=464988 /ORGANISM="Hemiselmis andersenii, Strain CCMP644" /LENGTH=606 /DNA_ID=CAMNT_0001208527 /DNA_START=46 /DNA_END=1866 /DNA_ORIENTATION=+
MRRSLRHLSLPTPPPAAGPEGGDAPRQSPLADALFPLPSFHVPGPSIGGPDWGDKGSERSALSQYGARVVDSCSDAARRREGLLDPALNYEQVLAVERLLSASRPPQHPFVIFGPPGTGKTKTVAEAVLRAVESGHKVLVCAPSDSSADVVAERVVELAEEVLKRDPGREGGISPKEWIFRLNAMQRNPEEVRAKLLPFTRIDAQCGRFQVPPLAELAAFRAIVATCAGASLLAAQGVERGHFTLIAVDEAAQALEPETLVPLSLAGQDTSVCLSGDWKQLGAVVRSKAASSLGLSMSLLERLMSLPHYQSPHCANVVTLRSNYRSQPSLLSLPSDLFYHSALVPCVDQGIADSMLWASARLLEEGHEPPEGDGEGEEEEEGWFDVEGFPMIFYGVEGRDVCDDDTPSFYNPTEALMVRQIVLRILAMEGGKVSTNEIGIIAPYRKQVKQIRLLLRSEDLGAVRVGTVDDYQGQEERIIIISTTLTNRERLSTDKQHSVGFLGNPKRFNVALTRAMALCIVVGNPYVMLAEPHWRALLQFCVDNGSYLGCQSPLSRREGDEVQDQGEGDALEALIAERMLGVGAAREQLGDLEALMRDETEFRVLM